MYAHKFFFLMLMSISLSFSLNDYIYISISIHMLLMFAHTYIIIAINIFMPCSMLFTKIFRYFIFRICFKNVTIFIYAVVVVGVIVVFV